MLKIRSSNERGFFDHGWLKTYHTFSFADYRDPEFMGFGPLRVINEDYIAAGRGFGTHPHRNMEIITVVIQGELSHKDSMGNGSAIKPGEIQMMSAGRGVTHSEFNSNLVGDTHLFQIWIMPDREETEPRYDQRHIDYAATPNQLRLLAGPQANHTEAVQIYQNATLSGLALTKKSQLNLPVSAERLYYIQMVSGSLQIQADSIQAGDGLFVSEESALEIYAGAEGANLLFFDLPK